MLPSSVVDVEFLDECLKLCSLETDGVNCLCAEDACSCVARLCCATLLVRVSS